MTKERCEMFLALLHKIVHEDASVAEKKAALLAQAGDMDKTNLLEFFAWFEEEDLD